MGLYHRESGYANIPWIYDRGLTWQAITGGRGTGKTYGALALVLDRAIPFMFIRRTQAQTDLINKPEFNPFKAICSDRGISITTRAISKYSAGFYIADEEGVPQGSPIGYTGALSTISNMRGWDASDVELLIFDEFQPERHERPLKHEWDALANAYETINRNRELKGRPPLRVLLLSNANTVGNPIYVGLDLVKRAARMVERHVELWEDLDRGIGLYMLSDSPVSRAKAETALYKLTAGSAFADMALDNQFSADRSSTIIRSRPLNQLDPIVNVGGLCLYRVRSDPALIYASTHASGTPPEYEMTDTDLLRVRRVYSWIFLSYLDGLVECEDTLAESLLQTVFNV